jgi:hypothetical protein
MNLKPTLPAAILVSAAVFFSCTEKPDSHRAHFTKADSLTDTYLALQDSVLQTWNLMINDDNQKIEAMHNLIHELRVGGGVDRESLSQYEDRLSRLKRLRYTQKSMANPDVITEYDFASNTMVSELIALAEAQRQFGYNTTLQKLVDNIRTADLRVSQYRESYDVVTVRYNEFVNENRKFLKDMDSDSMIEEKPLFQMVSDD